ncbi:MAG: DNA-formamidopyrimidine glycosylase [Candidatus Omnitrophica bacterium 4484_70.1]|nr:MAG: DNA-formamidopyrimidine glycosylase [Candidatus Omnitrophica bacterium 4484_70.1]
MPELPEVETIRQQLKEKISRKEIEEVIIKDKRPIKGISKNKFIKKVTHQKFMDILRRGKVLIFKLKENLFIVVHLRLTGWFILSKEIEKFSRVIFKLSDGYLLNFCDSRMFGEIKLVEEWQNLPIIKEMGPEPLELDFDGFFKLFERKKTKIKPLLMDQKFLAGIGNVYSQEALFCAKIHPERSADKISKQEYKELFRCLTSILKKAIEKKGSSVDTYRQIDGKEGEFIPFLKVYQREGLACVRCKTPIRKKNVGGRGTYFCPECQV